MVEEQVKSLVHAYVRDGWHTSFSMGRYDQCGCVGARGCCFPSPWELVAPLDVHKRPTNNRAELEVAIAVVLNASQCTVTFGDSKYILDGVKGEAYK